MKFSPYSVMTDALLFTREGRLGEATSLIKSTLSRDLPAGPAPVPTAETTPLERLQGLLSHRQPSPSEVGGGDEPNRMSTSGGRFLAKSYSEAGKSLDYRLYLPAGMTSAMPLVVMLHGCTQSAEDFARGTRMNDLADELGFLVAYPSQTHAANAQKCWNWFKPSDQQRGRGEPALIAGVTRQVIAEQACDKASVYIAGLSAGGAAAAVMASAYPDLYAAVGVHSGLPCGAARDVPSALMAMKQGRKAGHASRLGDRFVPLITFHGDRDMTVNEINSRQLVGAASDLAGTLKTRIVSGTAAGREFTRAESLNDHGKVVIEQWTVQGAGHAWSGGSDSGSYTDRLGPDASREMVRFFLTHHLP